MLITKMTNAGIEMKRNNTGAGCETAELCACLIIDAVVVAVGIIIRVVAAAAAAAAAEVAAGVVAAVVVVT